LRPKPAEVTNTGPAGNGEKLRPDSQIGPGPKHESQETIRLCLGVRGTAASAGLGRQTPTQTGGTGLGRGCESVPACACALSHPPQLPPPPNHGSPQNPALRREVSAVWPAQPRGIKTQPGPEQGLSQDPPGLDG